MKLAEFKFTKIYAEKEEKEVKEIKIDAKINIQSIKEIKSNFLNSKESLLNVNFEYKIEYKEFAKIEFGGNLTLVLDIKKSKEILKNFDSQKLEENFKLSLFNLILRKSSVKALQLEEELGIPPHFKLPTLKSEKKD